MNIEEKYDKIYRYCFFRTSSKETAEDLTQETFLRYLSSNYVEKGKSIQYLYTIARNLCIDESKKEKKEVLPEDISDDGEQEKRIINQIRIRNAMAELNEEDRDLFVMRYMNEESVEDICKITGISRFALYRKMKRIKSEFIRFLGEEEI